MLIARALTRNYYSKLFDHEKARIAAIDVNLGRGFSPGPRAKNAAVGLELSVLGLGAVCRA